jgi:DNA-directed RNA polymerase specialized sigma24 family protein
MKPLSQSEFNLTVRAKNGDASANLELWERYKPVAISLLKYVRGLSFEEKISEAYMIFIHKLEIFNPDKVLAVRDPNTFTFSYMVIGGFKNLKRKLITEWKKYNGNVSFNPLNDEMSEYYGFDKEYPFIVADKKGKYFIITERASTDLFDLNNPLNALTKSNERELQKKERLFYTRLSDFQKKILEMRREGKTYQEIGNVYGCSSTKIKKHYAEAKGIANKIFNSSSDRNY